MGLDIIADTENGFSFRAGSYSGFSSWRVALCKIACAGDLEKMDGYTPAGYKWTGKEPFFKLFDHSDCDGTLSQSACKKLAKDFNNEVFIKAAERYEAEHPESWFLERFNSWRRAVNLVAKQGGHIQFC